MSVRENLNVVPYTVALQKLSKTFSSGNDHLDRFLKESVSLDDNFGKTYVWLSEKEDFIVGYYNIGTGSIDEVLPDSERYKIGGSIHINEFALDKAFHGMTQGYTESGDKINISDLLLDDCLQRIADLRSQNVGFTFVTLCSTEEGFHLYARNGFEELDDGMQFSLGYEEKKCIRMYSPMEIDY